MGATKSGASEPSVNEDEASPLAAGDDEKREPAGEEAKDASAVPIVFRVLIGAAGLAMLVGFFFPWVTRQLEQQGETAVLSGLALLQQESIAGTPPLALVVVPLLGTALAAVAFTGFRYTAHAAIGVAIVLFGYAAYVLFQLFTQFTGVGLWVTTGAAFLALVLGAGTLGWMRRVAKKVEGAKGAKETASGSPSS